MQPGTVPARYLDIPGFAPAIGLWPSFPNSGGDRRTTVTSAAQMRQDLNDMWVDRVLQIPLPDEVRRKIMGQNAMRLLRLAEPAR